MAGFWDKLKKLFSGDAPAAPGTAAAPPPPPAAPPPAGPPPASPPPTSPKPSGAASALWTAAKTVVSAVSGPAPKNPFAAPGILGLSAEELRKRALKIDPYRTAWIGRVDTIPPQSDERTAIIDRGLILRGFLTEEQIAEIHQAGDAWLRFAEADRLATSLAQAKRADIEAQLEAEKAAKKAAKKAAALAKHQARRAAVAARKASDIIHLGRGVSARLNDRRANIEKLNALGLPVLATPADVARALGLEIGRLRWLCFHSLAMERPHYVTFSIQKRSGGLRTISAPMPALAKAQGWIHREILSRLPTEAPAHGFIKERSILTNAAPHQGQDVVVNVDLSDFFPTIGFRRVRGVFQGLGYSPAVATVLALLTTEAPRMPVEYAGQKLAVAVGERALPQGASTSPAISNQVARRLDRRLAGYAAKLGWRYTRYADDLSFSAPAAHRQEIPRLLAKVRHVVEEEGFAINPKKGRVQRRGRRQEVTGVVVNDKLGVKREEIRRLRALLHQAKTTGLEAQNRHGHPAFRAHIEGKIAYVSMIDRAKGEKLRQALALVK